MKSLVFAAAGCAALLLAASLGAAPGASKAKVSSCSCVAFRLDDIQDYFLNHVQVEVMEVFDRRNVSLTVGVIGNYFGSDPMIANYVKGRAGDPLFEVANHGWDHENFAALGRDEQSALVQSTNKKIFDLLGVRPEVFIAPYNIVNEDTFGAMQENGVRYISANVKYDPPPYDIGGNPSFYRFPETALMGDLNDDTAWLTFARGKVFTEIEDSLTLHGFAVVAMHPQNFAARDMLVYQNMVDHGHAEELEMLLDRISEHDIKVVTINEINRHVVWEPEFYLQTQPRKETEMAGG